MASAMFGWDLVYKLVENDITKKDDILVLLVHWCLIKAGFKCLGIGADKILKDGETGSESLPSDWNKRDSYALRYLHGNNLYTLRATRTEGDLVFNLVRVADASVSIIHFNVEQTVSALRGPIETLVPEHTNLVQRIQRELVDEVFSGNQREATTQTARNQRAMYPPEPHQPAFDPRTMCPPPHRVDPLWDPSADPLAVGRSDVSPFGPPGGGMLFNPFGTRGGIRQPDPGPIPGGLPRGSIPPGARFDPFGPPGIGPRPPGRGFGGPDPDHLPPPGYDDMFM